jgi:integrase/recombinase XerD
MFLAQTMAIRRLKDDRLPSNGGRFDKRVGSVATVSTLPTVKAMRDCFERYLNLTIASGNASVDTIKTYRNRTAQFREHPNSAISTIVRSK